ncbi:MAG: DUF4390 domain-containing protein [Burkholderiaceae bacterium]
MIARVATAVAMLAMLLGVWPQARAAGTIQVTRAELVKSVVGAELQLSADVYLPVTSRMRDVLALGVPLHFVLEFRLTEPRWYWRDKRVTSAEQRYRLSYHPVTRRYRVSRFGFPQDYVGLDQAIASLTHVRGWSVVSTLALDPDVTYEAAVRMRLDTDLLPGPLQIDLFTNRDWDLESEWKRFPVTLAKATSGR